jgi:ATP-binding cassette, subfamily B, multidrug efflux pump
MKQLLRLRPFLRAYWWQILLSLIFLLCLTGLSLVIPAIIRQVIDVGLSQGDVTLLIQAAAIILVIGIIRAILIYFQRYLSEWVAQHIAYDLRNQLYDHIQNLPFSFHDHSQTGQLISRCIEDVRSIQAFTGSSLVELVRLSLLLSGTLYLLFSQNARLAAIGLLPLVPLALMTTRFGQRITGLFWAVDNALGELSSRLQENVLGAQVVRAFAREPFEIQRFDQTNRALFDARIKVNSEWSRILSSSNFLVTLGTILILWFGGQMVLAGQMSVGELVAFNSYLLILAGPVQQLTWVVNSAGEAIAGVQRTYEILDRQPEIQSPKEAVVLPPLSGQVDFEQVDFNYQGETARALAGISVAVKPNQLIALIGPTGSGKTSLVSLIPRFYDVAHGQVLVDGIDVRQVELVSLRKQIGIVLQTSLLFSTSVQENIAYGRPDASLEEVIAAAKAAQAHDFIQALPNRYDTIVGERGVTLSGGQRQRIAIARALLMDPRILILDDSTSSVDTQTEFLIQQALDWLMEGRTTFVIAHRLSTVKRADLILVMEDGRIVERGKHTELLANNGLYREIYDLQLRDQEQFREDMEAMAATTRRVAQFPIQEKAPQEE